jgi:hypothetical protein
MDRGDGRPNNERGTVEKREPTTGLWPLLHGRSPQSINALTRSSAIGPKLERVTELQPEKVAAPEDFLPTESDSSSRSGKGSAATVKWHRRDYHAVLATGRAWGRVHPRSRGPRIAHFLADPGATASWKTTPLDLT